MTKVTLTAVYHNDKDRDGKPYVAQKTGKPYTKCNIKCTEYGDKYLSGFGNAVTKTWNVGDTVEIDIEQKGEYLNFSTPRKETGSGMSDMDRETMNAIREMVFKQGARIETIIQILQGSTPKKDTYPEYKGEPNFTPEDEPIDSPF